MKFIRATDKVQLSAAQEQAWDAYGLIGHMLDTPATLDELVERVYKYTLENPGDLLGYDNVAGRGDLEILAMVNLFTDGAHFRLSLGLVRLIEAGLVDIYSLPQADAPLRQI